MKSTETKEPEDYRHTYTVGELLDYIEKHNIPRHGKVLIQRVEDKYFEGCDISGFGGFKNEDGSYGNYPPGSRAKPWSTVKRPDYMYNVEVTKIKDIKNRRKEYPRITDEILENMEKFVDSGSFFNEYIPIHSPVGYDDFEHLYLDAHY